jgi:tRNA dimethylallyltransferase
VWQKQETSPLFPEATYETFMAMHPREEIYARIDKRFALMMKNGALEEVQALMALNLPPELPILRAHGVPELMAHLRGEMALDDAIQKAQQNTRNYAKRQMTWLRNQLPEAKEIS